MDLVPEVGAGRELYNVLVCALHSPEGDNHTAQVLIGARSGNTRPGNRRNGAADRLDVSLTVENLSSTSADPTAAADTAAADTATADAATATTNSTAAAA
ncbi:MAG: hypothetical protein ACOVT5_06755, partial [Armatimonadaceae bacterium]